MFSSLGVKFSISKRELTPSVVAVRTGQRLAGEAVVEQGLPDGDLAVCTRPLHVALQRLEVTQVLLFPPSHDWMVPRFFIHWVLIASSGCQY